MQGYLDLYLAWSGPNVIAALAGASIVWFLTTLRKPRHLQHYFMAVGTGVLLVIAVSAIAALLGIAPVMTGGVPGMTAGVISAFLLRPKS